MKTSLLTAASQDLKSPTETNNYSGVIRSPYNDLNDSFEEEREKPKYIDDDEEDDEDYLDDPYGAEKINRMDDNQND